MDPSKIVTLSLHLGAHKTASTHLQKTLRLNSDLLNAEGISFYGPAQMRRRGATMRHIFGLMSQVKGAPKRTPPAQLSFMARHGTRVVISEENFWGVLHDKDGRFRCPIYPLGANRVQRLAENIAPHWMQVFLAIRDPATFLTSAYSQSLYGGNRITLDQYLDGVGPLDLKWHDVVADLAAADGPADVFVWRYEDYHAILPMIIRRMTRWRLGPKFEPFAQRLHPGLSAKAVAMALASDDADPEFAARARDSWPISDAHPRFEPWSEDLRQASAEAYARDVERIAALPGITLLRP